jgi:hypothetical protein
LAVVRLASVGLTGKGLSRRRSEAGLSGIDSGSPAVGWTN